MQFKTCFDHATVTSPIEVKHRYAAVAFTEEILLYNHYHEEQLY
jgi:hypothetical protein